MQVYNIIFLHDNSPFHLDEIDHLSFCFPKSIKLFISALEKTMDEPIFIGLIDMNELEKTKMKINDLLCMYVFCKSM